MVTTATTAVIVAETSAAHRPTYATPVRPQTLRRTIHSEWIKFRTLRSSWIGLASVAFVLVALAAAASAVSAGAITPPDGGPPVGGAGFSMGPLETVLTGANFAVLLLGVFGALAGAREFGSGMITASVMAVPRRSQIVIAKALVFGASSLVVAVVGVLGAFWIGMGILSAGGQATVGLMDAGVLRQVLGMAVYVTAVGLIGLGLGILLRSVAGSIGATIGGILVVPAFASLLLPDSWSPILRFLPSSAAAAFAPVQGAGSEVLSPGVGAIVLAVWVLAILCGAVASLVRRDV